MGSPVGWGSYSIWSPHQVFACFSMVCPGHPTITLRGFPQLLKRGAQKWVRGRTAAFLEFSGSPGSQTWQQPVCLSHPTASLCLALPEEDFCSSGAELETSFPWKGFDISTWRNLLSKKHCRPQLWVYHIATPWFLEHTENARGFFIRDYRFHLYINRRPPALDCLLISYSLHLIFY